MQERKCARSPFEPLQSTKLSLTSVKREHMEPLILSSKYLRPKFENNDFQDMRLNEKT